MFLGIRSDLPPIFPRRPVIQWRESQTDLWLSGPRKSAGLGTTELCVHPHLNVPRKYLRRFCPRHCRVQ